MEETHNWALVGGGTAAIKELAADAARWRYVRDHLAVIGPTAKWWEFDHAYGIGSLDETVDRLILDTDQKVT